MENTSTTSPSRTLSLHPQHLLPSTSRCAFLTSFLIRGCRLLCCHCYRRTRFVVHPTLASPLDYYPCELACLPPITVVCCLSCITSTMNKCYLLIVSSILSKSNAQPRTPGTIVRLEPCPCSPLSRSFSRIRHARLPERGLQNEGCWIDTAPGYFQFRARDPKVSLSGLGNFVPDFCHNENRVRYFSLRR